MKELASEIVKTVEHAAATLSGMSDAEFSLKKSPEKWSKKEIIGHLIDSAQNNIQRFVRGQYEGNPNISYAQNDWVRLQGYQHYEKGNLIQLWVLINKHLGRILTAMDPVNYEKNCGVGTEAHTLSFLAKDYLVHLRHHLSQIEKG
jgi:DinB superfamily